MSLLTHAIDTPAQDSSGKLPGVLTSLNDNFPVYNHRGNPLGVLVRIFVGSHFADLIRVEHCDVGPVAFSQRASVRQSRQPSGQRAHLELRLLQGE